MHEDPRRVKNLSQDFADGRKLNQLFKLYQRFSLLFSTTSTMRRLIWNCQTMGRSTLVYKTGTELTQRSASTISNNSSFWSLRRCKLSPKQRKVLQRKFFFVYWRRRSEHITSLPWTRPVSKRLVRFFMQRSRRPVNQNLKIGMSQYQTKFSTKSTNQTCVSQTKTLDWQRKNETN